MITIMDEGLLIHSILSHKNISVQNHCQHKLELKIIELTITCLKSTIETLVGKGVKYVQS